MSKDPVESSGVWSAALANLLMVGTLACATLLRYSDPDLYYRSVQEDEWLEWGTFWAFLSAAGVAAKGALRQRRVTGAAPWFLAGVSAFCLFVAMEEISWGQRLLGYRPPAYFLERNFQQELNVHNVVATRIRKAALGGIILGYGVLLPLLERLASPRSVLRRATVVAPPLDLAPAFLVVFVTYLSYPWSHTGEWVEFALGLGFLFAALAQARGLGRDAPVPALAGAGTVLLAWWLVVVALGAGSTLVWRARAAAHPESTVAARAEVEALRRDFAEEGPRTRCGLHKRLYAYVEKYGQTALLSGEFSRLTARGLPEARARYFLDPWNSPYWIRDACSRDGRDRAIFVYSFGPDRRRDSSAWAVLGDDVGALVRREGTSAGARVEPTQVDTDAEP